MDIAGNTLEMGLLPGLQLCVDRGNMHGSSVGPCGSSTCRHNHLKYDQHAGMRKASGRWRPQNLIKSFQTLLVTSHEDIISQITSKAEVPPGAGALAGTNDGGGQDSLIADGDGHRQQAEGGFDNLRGCGSRGSGKGGDASCRQASWYLHQIKSRCRPLPT